MCIGLRLPVIALGEISQSFLHHLSQTLALLIFRMVEDLRALIRLYFRGIAMDADEHIGARLFDDSDSLLEVSTFSAFSARIVIDIVHPRINDLRARRCELIADTFCQHQIDIFLHMCMILRPAVDTAVPRIDSDPSPRKRCIPHRPHHWRPSLPQKTEQSQPEHPAKQPPSHDIFAPFARVSH